MPTLPDHRFRDGLLWFAATIAGSTLVTWAIAALVLEAVTLPDQQATVFVSLLSGLALLAFGASLVPFGISLRLVGAGILRSPIPIPLPLLAVPIRVPMAWQTRLRRIS